MVGQHRQRKRESDPHHEQAHGWRKGSARECDCSCFEVSRERSAGHMHLLGARLVKYGATTTDTVTHARSNGTKVEPTALGLRWGGGVID